MISSTIFQNKKSGLISQTGFSRVIILQAL